ncbi:DUF2092 domain-containing protein [Candidatus Binatus sp.]|uniref:DUF2092 domain-containing protein n=1 Tax=Candidatus Binatus sp. TaxID=2811406 RepID=UPI002B49E150|nr:DUF2092 domain-containing protein [Candidatus Binatus sp.]
MSFKFAAAACGAAMGIALALNAALAADPSASPTQAAPPVQAAPQPPRIDPHADDLLTKTCEALGSADALSFHAEILFDKVLPRTVKVQYAAEMNFALERPDELVVDYHSDLGGKQLWYQRDTLTIFDEPHEMYASMKVPSSIDTMLDQVEQTQHLTLPLSNLAYSDPCSRIRKQIIFGSYIGVNDVNGVDCDHVAFSSRNIDLQLWLDRSGKPVPRKIVINYRTEPGSPEYIAVLSDWKFPKQISDNRFSPHLPKDAKRIEFLKVKESQP